MNAVDKLLSLDLHPLVVRKDIKGQIMVDYCDCGVKDGYFLRGITGRGDTFEEACEDYLNQITGKTLIFNPNTDSEKRVTVL